MGRIINGFLNLLGPVFKLLPKTVYFFFKSIVCFFSELKIAFKLPSKLHSLFLIFLVILLTGCATRPDPLTRKEYINHTTKVYNDASKSEIFEAAKNVFLLSDGNDFSFSYTENSMQANNNWMIYAVIATSNGTDRWRIKTEETEKGIKSTVQVSTTSQSSQATAYGAYTSNQQRGQTPKGPAIFKLFWFRMDYLIGTEKEWISCSEMKKIKDKNKNIWGSIQQLCRAGSWSLNPDEVIAWKSQKVKEDSDFRVRNKNDGDYPIAKSNWKKMEEGPVQGTAIYKVPTEYLLKSNGINI